MATRPLALFDDTHGQANWAQTGFPSRERHTNFAGVAEVFGELGCPCASIRPRALVDGLRGLSLLVLPPPTGLYDSTQECWQYLPGTHFTPEEVRAVLGFLHRGGRMLAFGYRFGDSFTRTNLNDLFCPLGCPLNNDVVIDLTRLREVHPLQFEFVTGPEAWFQPGVFEGVRAVHWRSLATFTILPGATLRPLALSPGGRCITYDRGRRRISFQSSPVAVAGCFGQGRVALVGGPHVFEVGPLGLLDRPENRRFLRNILDWLLRDDGRESELSYATLDEGLMAIRSAEQWRDVCQVRGNGTGESTVAFVERVLHESGVLSALAKPTWLP